MSSRAAFPRAFAETAVVLLAVAGSSGPAAAARPAEPAAGGGLPPGGAERRPGGGGVPAHTPHDDAPGSPTPTSGRSSCPDILPGATARAQGPAHLPAAQLGSGQLPVPRRHGLVHGPAALRGPPARDAAERGPVHEREGRHPGRPRPRVPGSSALPSLFGAARVREGRAASRSRSSSAARPGSTGWRT